MVFITDSIICAKSKVYIKLNHFQIEKLISPLVCVSKRVENRSVRTFDEYMYKTTPLYRILIMVMCFTIIRERAKSKFVLRMTKDTGR